MDRPAKEAEDPVLVGGFRFGGGMLLFLFDAGGSPRDSKKAAILALLSRLSTCLMNGVNLTFFAFAAVFIDVFVEESLPPLFVPLLSFCSILADGILDPSTFPSVKNRAIKSLVDETFITLRPWLLK
jgi:hypothetical protein